MIYAIHHQQQVLRGDWRPMSDEEKRLWECYRLASTKSESDELRNQILEMYLPMAKRMADRKSERTPGCVDADDLFSAAYEGLLHSIPRFDPTLGFAPATFFQRRIAGAMSDSIRKNDQAPRRYRQLAAQIERWQHTDLGRPATREEIAYHLGFDLPSFPVTQSLSEPVRDDMDGRLVDLITDHRTRGPNEGANELSDLLRGCTTRERLLLIMYYIEGNSMAEIGEQLDISESRVSQQMASLLLRMRSAARSRLNLPEPAQQPSPITTRKPRNRLQRAQDAYRLLTSQPHEALLAIDARIALHTTQMTQLKVFRRRLVSTFSIQPS